MKNIVQVVDTTAHRKIYHELENIFVVDNINNGSYHRYYPKDDSVDVKVLKIINDYLFSEGYTVNSVDEYFYLLIYFNW